jgi:hypothetical protein
MSTKHIVIIGAARSGTKILRDALAEATAAGRVPYDIGYVWRIGNEDRQDDVIRPDEISDRSKRFIRQFVNRYAAADPNAVIEKTVGNAMRVPAVAEVLPDAFFVHLVRDGVDVIESTRRQWSAATDRQYLIRKLHHFPLRLAPTYGLKYARSLAHRRAGHGSRVGSWGPRYPGIDADLQTEDLLVVCARQWREAVRCAARDLAHVGSPVIEVRYERLVKEPRSTLDDVARFAGMTTKAESLAAASATIVPGRQGMGRESLTPTELNMLEIEVGDLLSDLGYDRPRPLGPADAK